LKEPNLRGSYIQVRSWLHAARSYLNSLARCAVPCVLLFMSIGVEHDWRYGRLPDEHFANSLQHKQDAQPADRIVKPIVPDGWHMELVKRNLWVS
jgi:hypothetical protein